MTEQVIIFANSTLRPEEAYSTISGAIHITSNGRNISGLEKLLKILIEFLFNRVTRQIP